MNAPIQAPLTALQKVRAQYRYLNEADVLSILVDLIQRSPCAPRLTDNFIDALSELDDALVSSWNYLQACADEADGVLL